jgi:hypothetical protein
MSGRKPRQKELRRSRDGTVKVQTHQIVEDDGPTAGRLLDWPRRLRGLTGETSDELKGTGTGPPWRGNGPQMIARRDVLHREDDYVQTTLYYPMTFKNVQLI